MYRSRASWRAANHSSILDGVDVDVGNSSTRTQSGAVVNVRAINPFVSATVLAFKVCSAYLWAARGVGGGGEGGTIASAAPLE